MIKINAVYNRHATQNHANRKASYISYEYTSISTQMGKGKQRIIKAIIFVIMLSLADKNSLAQPQDTIHAYPLQLDLPLLDYPYLKESSRTRQFFNSFSMEQSLAITHDLHRVNYYLNNRLWHKIIPPDTKRGKVFNRIASNATSGLLDYVFTYYGVVFSVQWLHEEYHRNGLTIRGNPSYNETYNIFNGGDANGSVSKVRDEDLIRLKRESPQELIRSFSAGIESELLLLRGLQKDNFYRGSQYANILLNVLITKHTIDYVNQFKRDDYNASIDSMNTHGQAIHERDFVGWDFTPWVYDLHRPKEPYEERGLHPSGLGIDRAIKTTSLSPQEYRYLKKMGNMQYLNFISPFMVGINRININKHMDFNFAIRHYLNSFGYDLTTDFFINFRGKSYLLALHGYSNKNLFLPGVEAELPAFEIKKKANNNYWTLHPSAMLWIQPDNFYSTAGDLGGLIRFRTSYSLNNTWKVYVLWETKTKGWVAGQPYLESYFGIKGGVYAQFGNFINKQN